MKKIAPMQIIIKLLKTNDKEEILKQSENKVMWLESNRPKDYIRVLLWNNAGENEWSNVLKYWEQRWGGSCQPLILCPVNIPREKNEDKTKIFLDMQKFEEFITGSREMNYKKC